MAHPGTRPEFPLDDRREDVVLTPGPVSKGERRDDRSSDFVTTSGKIDEDALEKLWRRGSEAWAGVDNASAWVDELRGH